MSYLPLLLIGLIGVALFIAAMTLPRRRRSHQEQTIDREPELPRQGEPGTPGSRPDRASHGKP